jgi:hypothetical protein
MDAFVDPIHTKSIRLGTQAPCPGITLTRRLVEDLAYQGVQITFTAGAQNNRASRESSRVLYPGSISVRKYLAGKIEMSDLPRHMIVRICRSKVTRTEPGHYPFTLPSVRPAMICFCSTRKIRNVGTNRITMPANRAGHSAAYCCVTTR